RFGALRRRRARAVATRYDQKHGQGRDAYSCPRTHAGAPAVTRHDDQSPTRDQAGNAWARPRASAVRWQSASELNAYIAQHIGDPRDRRAHLGLKLVLLAMLVVDRALDRGDAQFMLAHLDGQVGTHLLNIRAKAQIARDRPCSYRHQEDGGLEQVPEIDFRAEPRPQPLLVAHLARPTILIPPGPKLKVLVSPATCKLH